jgi:hypothetical protein
MAATLCVTIAAPADGRGVARRALRAASRYDGREATGAGLSSELPVPGLASAQRLAFERPTELPLGWKGAAWGERDDDLGDGPSAGCNVDSDSGGSRASCMTQGPAVVDAGVGAALSSSSSSSSKTSSTTTSSSGSCVVVLGTPTTSGDPMGEARGRGGAGPGPAIVGGATTVMERMEGERAEE